MSDVESRLRELRGATEGQLRPSPRLLNRIESSLEPSGSRRWTPAIALAAVALIVLAVALLPAGRDDMEVASGPPTRAEYVEAMNQRCEEDIAETERVQVVSRRQRPTPWPPRTAFPPPPGPSTASGSSAPRPMPTTCSNR